MKIIILGPAYPYRGGISDTNHRLAKELLESGYSLEIYTFSLQYPYFLFPGKSQFHTSEFSYPYPIYRNINSINPFNWIYIGIKIAKSKPDFVLFRYWLSFLAPCFGTIAIIVRFFSNVKSLAIVDNMIPHEPKFFDSLFSKYFLWPIHGFISMSEKVSKDICKFTSNKPIEFAPHPIFDNFGEKASREAGLKFLNLTESKKYILFFGFIRKYKGLDLLLDAFSIIRKSNTEIELIVAGEFYEDESTYLSQIDSLGLKPFIHLHTHFIAQEDVKYYFSVADVVVQPYRNATQSGIAQICYHFEKPMIVTDVGGLKEIIEENVSGISCAPNSEAIVEAINRFFNFNINWVAGVKSQKHRFSWKNLVGAIEKLYSKVK